MSLPWNRAKSIALEYLSDSEIPLAIEEEVSRRIAGGWVIFYNSAEYKQSGAIEHALLGNAPLIVSDHEELIVTGTGIPVEEYIATFERGLRTGPYTLRIDSVADTSTTVHYLLKLRPSYVEAEEAHGVIWRIPKAYSAQQLRKMLESLPVVFQNLFGFSPEALRIIEAMYKNSPCRFIITPALEPAVGHHWGDFA